MVFSFFKKAPEKMVAKPAAVPRPKEEIAVESKAPPERVESAGESSKDTNSLIEFSDFVFSESSPDFQIEGDVDPIDAAAEEAAVLFANGQDVRGACLNGHNRRLPQNDSPISHVHKGVRGAQVYANIIGEQAFKLRKHESCLTPPS